MKKLVKLHDRVIGDGKITVQSMTNLPVTDIEGTTRQIQSLIDAECDFVRIAIPNANSLSAFRIVRSRFDIPLIADIHFDYRLALGAIEAGADKIRINPGNILPEQLDSVIDCAKQNGVAIRIGVNGGSVNKEALVEAKGDKNLALVNSLTEYVRYFEKRNFENLVLSVKSSDVLTTIATNRQICKLGYPIHLGVTEAGVPQIGIVKNAIGIGTLLQEGIGDTIRVSLTGGPVEEVAVAKEILRSLHLASGVTFVSCPKCGRCSVDLEGVASQVYNYVKDLPANVKIAVMGCEVNGPGECADADLGIAGAAGQFVFFKRGVKYKTVTSDVALEEFKKEIDLLIHDN